MSAKSNKQNGIVKKWLTRHPLTRTAVVLAAVVGAYIGCWTMTDKFGLVVEPAFDKYDIPIAFFPEPSPAPFIVSRRVFTLDQSFTLICFTEYHV